MEVAAARNRNSLKIDIDSQEVQTESSESEISKDQGRADIKIFHKVVTAVVLIAIACFIAYEWK